MSGMADEMARRIQEDQGAGLPDGADRAPGSGGASGQQTPPPAGESNTDTGAAPETIPYARFKEVNDRYQQLKDFEQLTEYGYDPDSLGRLAAFEAQYLHDPVGTWAALADNLDLPDDLAEAVKAHVAGNTPSNVPAQGEPSEGNGPTADLPEEVKSALEYVGQLRQREESANEDKLLNDTLSYWDKLDEADGLQTSEKMQLAIISAMSNSGVVFPTTEKLVEAARAQVLEYRDEVLGSAVRTGRGGAPLSVPGSRSAPAGPVDFGMDIKAATKAAADAIQRGELPPIVRD
jgi:hypothetical protein